MLLAIYEEYDRAVYDLIKVMKNVSVYSFTKIRDEETMDKDCESIKAIIFHVVQSGYTYANYINQLVDGERKEYDLPIKTPVDGIAEIEEMMKYTKQAMASISHFSNDELLSKTIIARWKTTYDPEQLLEHAIVHILRHRRQIENFLRK